MKSEDKKNKAPMCFFLSGKIPSPNKNECILNAERDSRDKEINISRRIYTEYAFQSSLCVCREGERFSSHVNWGLKYGYKSISAICKLCDYRQVVKPYQDFVS